MLAIAKGFRATGPRRGEGTGQIPGGDTVAEAAALKKGMQESCIETVSCTHRIDYIDLNRRYFDPRIPAKGDRALRT